MKLIAWTLILFVGACRAGAAPIEIPRPDGSMIHFYFERPSNPTFPILMVLHGSTCTSSWPLTRMVSTMIGQKVGVVSVEKYGLNERSTECPQSYIDNNTIDGRVQDLLQVVAYLRGHAPGWNGSLGWAGGSEGGQVAALTGPLVPETKLIVMLASGGGLTMAEELPIAMTRSLERSGASSAEIARVLDDVQVHYRLIKDNPTSRLEWLSDGRFARNTYQWWNSILWKDALPLLESANVPMYIAHGTEDTSCPIESSDAIAERFRSLGRTNLTFKRYPGLEHNWSDLSGTDHSKQVLGDAFAWVLQNL